MASVIVEVFTSPTCPHCPGAVKATKELFTNHPDLKNDVQWKEMSTASPIGYKKAVSYGIQAVPTIIITNLNTNEHFGIVGVPSEKKYLEYIYKALGKTPNNYVEEKENKGENKKEKSSFLDKFANMFK